jgi:hypothetical protein
MQWDRHLRALLRLMTETPAERTQREVQEIAEVLSRQSSRSIVEVWNEASSLHRVRYETEVRAGPEESENAGR